MAKPWKELGRYGTVGLDLVLSIVILGGIGRWLDGRFWHEQGWGTLGGFLLGVAVGVRNLVWVARRMQRDIERAEAADPQAHRWTVDESWVYRDSEEVRGGTGKGNGL
jgi:F0F1-type ATP synthase assembly protein I